MFVLFFLLHTLAMCHELGPTVQAVREERKRANGHGDNEQRAGQSGCLTCSGRGDSLMLATQLDSQFASACVLGVRDLVLIAYTRRATTREKEIEIESANLIK